MSTTSQGRRVTDTVVPAGRTSHAPVLVPLVDGSPDLLGALREIRAAGNVPLVGDSRWRSSLGGVVSDAAVGYEVPRGTGWAALTSGSSGAPRIVLRTETSWSDSFTAVEQLLEADSSDVIALPAPASSSLTLFSLAHALAGGPRPLLLPAAGAAAGAGSAVTLFHGTPQALSAMLEKGVPKSLRAALVGGSHVDPALRLRAESAGIRVISYYGAAELSFVAVDQGRGLEPFPGVEIDVRQDELWVRSDYVCTGYAQLVGGAPGQYRSGGPLRRAGDWATVGDRAEYRDGRLRLLGRADQAILSASATVVPEEVEAVLRGIAGVRDAMVFGLPREPVGALVAAYLECEEALNVADLRRVVEPLLAPAHRPRLWFAGELPRTSSGKPARNEAVRQVIAGEVKRLG